MTRKIFVVISKQLVTPSMQMYILFVLIKERNNLMILLVFLYWSDFQLPWTQSLQI